MDSITHLATGACIGGLAASKDNLRAPMLWGAVFGVLPDIDVFIGIFLTDMQALTLHRGFTHGILFLVLAPFLAGYVPARLHPHISYKRWVMIAFLVLLSHLALDYVTSYGTQLLAPFSDQLFYAAVLSIIDPLFSMPLLLAVFLVMSKRFRPYAKKLLAGGLLLSTLYLGWCFSNKNAVESVFVENLEEQEIDYNGLDLKPTLLNNLLWHGTAKTNEGYYIGYYSLLDDQSSFAFAYTPRNHEWLEPRLPDPKIERLLWFADGYYKVEAEGTDSLRFHNLRFGRSAGWTDRETNYVFSYRIRTDESTEGVKVSRVPLSFDDERDRPRFGELWERMLGR